MHPSYYPFIRNGPDCACTHRRVRHVGVNEYGFPSIDRGCADCAVCERYTPLEAIDHALEDLQRDEILANERRRRTIHQRIVYASLVPLVLAIPAMVWAPGLVPWLVMVLVSVNVGNLGVSQLHSWRTGDLSTGEATMELVAIAGLFGFFIAYFADARFVAYVLLMIGVGCSFAVGFVTQSWLKRSMQSLARLQADLRKQSDEP